MSSPNATRRSRYSRSRSRSSPREGAPPSKRSKPSESEQNRLYTSICVKNINPKISDPDLRELCAKKFSKYGNNTVKIFYKNQERVAFVNFTNCDDAKKARHAKTGLVWDNIQVVLEPVYYRRTIPAEQPLNSESPPHRSRRRSPSPLPPPSSSSRRYHHTSSPPPPPARGRRHYSPFIPLPPDLADYAHKKGSSSRSPVRRRSRSRSRSKSNSSTSSPRAYKSRSKNDDMSSNFQHEPTRTLFVGNLERDIRESKLREVFGRYGTIEEIDLKVPQSSSKRAYAFIQYENMDMAYDARRAMDGHFIGKADCKIGYGKIVPTNCLWVGNIPIEMKRRDLEDMFARYGQIKSFDYETGDPIAIVTFNDIEDAIKARGKMTGVTEINDGKKVRSDSVQSDSSRRDGIRIDYLDRPPTRRFVIVRPQETKRRTSRSSSVSSHRSVSRSPSPSMIGRTSFGPFASFLSTQETNDVTTIDELIELCEKFHRNSTNNEHFPVIFPVQFNLKSHAYPVRLFFIGGNPNLAKQLLKTSNSNEKNELTLTQRLRLDQQKLDELEKTLKKSVTNSSSNRKSNSTLQMTFSILIGSSTKNNENGKNDDDDETSLSRFVSYLSAKEAAGVITKSIPSNSADGQNEEKATLNIYPPCPFTKKILKNICPSISFSNGPHTPPSKPTTNNQDEHLMLVIVQNES